MGGAQEETVSVFGHKIKKSDLFKLVGLIVFIALIFGVVAALWPSLSVVFEPNGVDRLISDIKSQGPAGVLILLGLQLLQIVVAFIPGEVVQVAAGMLYGPFFGSLIILLGCVISSSIIYSLVHKLGAPFVQSMVSEKYLVKFYEFERSGKLNLIVFILFLIPAMPKDVFTYLVPLTNMRMRAFLILSTVGRIPGVIISTYAASGLAEGDITTSLIIFGIAAVLMVLGIIFRDKIFFVLGTQKALHKMDKERKEEEAEEILRASLGKESEKDAK